MNLIPWRNKSEGTADAPLTRLREEMDNVFRRFMGEGRPRMTRESEAASLVFGPTVDLAESEQEVTVTVELPGVEPKDVEIDVVGTALTIRGEKKHEREEKKRNYHYVERSFGQFHRSIPLPSTVDPEKVDATYKDGLLTVTIAKHPEAKPKRIAVKTS